MPFPSVPKTSHPLVKKLWGHIHRIVLTRISKWYCRWTGLHWDAAIWPLPFNLILKWSDGTREEEVLAATVARAIGLPVPRIISYGEHAKGPGSILMVRAPGKSLGQVYDDLTPAERDSISNELRHYLGIMRSYKSPWGNRICSVSGGTICSVRVPFGIVGPCSNEAEFDAQLIRTASSLGLSDFFFKDAYTSASRINEVPHSIVFTHGDLLHHNILIYEGHISAIIDWEAAGWYPEYWEFTTVRRFYPQGFWWTDFVKRLWEERYEKEFECECALWDLTCGSFKF